MVEDLRYNVAPGGGPMTILDRVQSLRNEEHMQLRMALGRADTALRELEGLAREESAPSAHLDMFGDPIGGAPEEEAPRRPSLGPLLVAWRPFEEALLERLDNWEMRLWPLVQRWARGESVGLVIQTVTAGLLDERKKLDEPLRRVRIESNFLPALRPAMMAVFSAIDQADQAEAAVLPALMSGSWDAASLTSSQAPARVRSAADVARDLRSNLSPRPVPEEQRKSLLQSVARMMGWVRQK